jgi:hypothetical protein
MLAAQMEHLDFDHLRRVAIETNLGELFDAALLDATHER